jgi:hypothetical protein
MTRLWHNGGMKGRGELSDPGSLWPFIEEEFRRSDERLEPLRREMDEQRRRGAAQLAERKAAHEADRAESIELRRKLREKIDSLPPPPGRD